MQTDYPISQHIATPLVLHKFNMKSLNDPRILKHQSPPDCNGGWHHIFIQSIFWR